MKFKNGKVQPCGKCLKARRAAKNVAQAISGRGMRYTTYTLEGGPRLIVERSTGNVVKVHIDGKTMSNTIRTDLINHLINERVYVAGKHVLNAETGDRLTLVGMVIRRQHHNELEESI